MQTYAKSIMVIELQLFFVPIRKGGEIQKELCQQP